MYEHGSAKKYNPFLFRKIQKIKSLGYKIGYEKWFEHEDSEPCLWMEIFLIAYGKEYGWHLCNLTAGGEGVFGPRSEEFKARMRGKGNPFYGKKHKEGKFKGRDSPMKGKKMSPEHLAKTRRTGSSPSKETKAKISASVKAAKALKIFTL